MPGEEMSSFSPEQPVSLEYVSSHDRYNYRRKREEVVKKGNYERLLVKAAIARFLVNTNRGHLAVPIFGHGDWNIVSDKSQKWPCHLQGKHTTLSVGRFGL